MELPKLKLNLTADGIYKREFKGNTPGYDCLQVDTLLDSVIADYEAFDEYCSQAQSIVSSMNRNQRVLEERNNQLTQQLSELQHQLYDLQSIAKLDPSTPRDQLSLLKRVAKLELALKDEGVDPSKII